MNWRNVIDRLRDEAVALWDRANSAFPNDIAVQSEMYSRAAIAEMLAAALEAGIDEDGPGTP